MDFSQTTFECTCIPHVQKDGSYSYKFTISILNIPFKDTIYSVERSFRISLGSNRNKFGINLKTDNYVSFDEGERRRPIYRLILGKQTFETYRAYLTSWRKYEKKYNNDNVGLTFLMQDWILTRMSLEDRTEFVTLLKPVFDNLFSFITEKQIVEYFLEMSLNTAETVLEESQRKVEQNLEVISKLRMLKG